MYNGGEAADQMVSYAFKGGEVVLRLSGAAAKNLAVYLTALLKQGGPSKGKTTLKRMIADGKELTVQRIDADQIPYFNAMAKKYGKKSERWLMGYFSQPEDFSQVDKVVDLYEKMGVDRLATWTYRGGLGTIVSAKDPIKLWDKIGENYKRVLKK